MQIFLNGELIETRCQTVLELVQELALENKRFAVEMDEMIISKTRLADTALKPNVRIEIIHAVGGG